MAQCKLTPREFICNAFSPQIAAICSTAADTVCQKNNLSFVELLQPFCKLNTEGKKFIIQNIKINKNYISSVVIK